MYNFIHPHVTMWIISRRYYNIYVYRIVNGKYWLLNNWRHNKWLAIEYVVEIKCRQMVQRSSAKWK